MFRKSGKIENRWHFIAYVDVSVDNRNQIRLRIFTEHEYFFFVFSFVEFHSNGCSYSLPTDRYYKEFERPELLQVTHV